MNSPSIIALQEALLAQGKRWGNVMFIAEQEVERRKTPAQRESNTLAKAEATETRMKAANIEKKKAKFVNRKGQLTKIAKQCKWECKGEKCWAHEGKTCPYIHKNQKGSNEAHAVTLKRSGGKRRLTRKTRKTRKTRN
jgi:hypothetical protein